MGERISIGQTAVNDSSIVQNLMIILLHLVYLKLHLYCFELRLGTDPVTTSLSAEHPGGKPPRDFVPSLEVSLPCRTSAIFGQNLRRARLRARLTQGDLARRTGLKQQYISLIESGYQNVTILTADALASAVGRKLWTMVSSGDPPKR
jgi:DNA-binding XRE family transcriptional regulator